MSSIDHDSHHDSASIDTVSALINVSPEARLERSHVADDTVVKQTLDRIQDILGEHREANHERVGPIATKCEAIETELRTDLASARTAAAASQAQAAAAESVKNRAATVGDQQTFAAAMVLLTEQTMALLQLDGAQHDRAYEASRETIALRTPQTDGSILAGTTGGRDTLHASQEVLERVTDRMRAFVQSHSDLEAKYTSTTPFSVSPEGVVTLFVAPNQERGEIRAAVENNEILIQFAVTPEGRVSWLPSVSGDVHERAASPDREAGRCNPSPHSDHSFTYTVFKTVPGEDKSHKTVRETGGEVKGGGSINSIGEVKGGGSVNGIELLGKHVLDAVGRLEGLYREADKTTDAHTKHQPVGETAITIPVQLQFTPPRIEVINGPTRRR